MLRIRISVENSGYSSFRTAASAVNEEVFESFSMFHLAGLKDFSFMKKCQNVGDLRARLLVTGVGAGAGQVWREFLRFYFSKISLCVVPLGK